MIASTELAEALGLEAGQIAACEHEPAGANGSHAACTVACTFRAGDVRRMFVKDLSASTLEKEDPEGRRARELYVYNELLPLADLGTARLHGAMWDESRHRFKLILEQVEGLELRYCDFDAWREAAAWLGSFQAARKLTEAALERPQALLRHDEGFFHARAKAAIAGAARYSADLGQRLTDALRDYDRCVTAMVTDEPVLLHGAFQPRNIIVASDRGKPRICPVDWELAGIGHPLHDLAFLVDGFAADERAQLIERYLGAAGGAGKAADGETDRVIDSFRMHRVLTWLWHAPLRGYAAEEVEGLVASAEDLATVISARR